MAASVLALIGLAVAVGVAVGGDRSDGPTAAEVDSSVSAAALADQRAEEGQRAEDERLAAEQAALEAERARDEYDECAGQVRPFMDSIQEVSSRLAVGLNYSEYGDFLGDARVAYDRIDIDELSYVCLNVAAPLEDSYNKHLSVHTLWGDCIDDYYCDFNTGATNREAQNKWVRADRDLAKAQEGLDGLEP